jgi:hypothetical protein
MEAHMLKQMLATLLLGAVGLGQVESPAETQVLRDGSPAKSKYETRSVPEYYKLRTGTSERIALRVDLLKSMSEVSDEISQGIYWKAKPGRGQPPVALSVETEQGLTITHVHYSTPTRAVQTALGKQRVIEPATVYVFFVVNADQNARVGDHRLKGALKFYALNNSELEKPQTLHFDIPLEIVRHNAQVVKNPDYVMPLGVWQSIGLILLAPILLPIGIFLWDGC